MSESVSGADAILRRMPNARLPVIDPMGPYVRRADAEAAVHATVREIVGWLRSEDGGGSYVLDFERHALADEVARRFGGTEA